MRNVAIVMFLMLVAPAGYAQIGTNELTLAGVSDCMKEAISAGSVERNGPTVIFFCNADKAKTLYNFLGRMVRSEIVQDRNGKFENRQFGNNACYHRTADPNGKS